MPDNPDDLAGVPPEEFVAARDALARRLKAEGKAGEAAEVKKLRRPTVTQWITGQVRRHHGDVIDALRAAVSDMAQAQETAMTGGDRDALRDATSRRREAADTVGRAVDQVLADTGRPAQHRDEVLTVIETGVTEEVASGTFGVRDDLDLPELPKKEATRDRVAERRAARAAAAIEAAEARVSRARAELEQAQSELEEVLERHREASAPPS